ncbi:MAG: glycosyltransferase family 2 protein [Alphaproteobacteria bacterium]|nr:glycosyltransferase family 2 protein [Alphaproteobacteria bacterium]
MQLLIPMSGTGSRFLKAGYKIPKPLIKVQGRPMISWVRSMFPDNLQSSTYICRHDHLAETHMRQEIINTDSKANIIGIEGHKKGPVHACLQGLDSLDDNKPVLITYCDYYMQWDFDGFVKYINQNNPEGAVPCYTGFHPHLLPAHNLYASCKIDENNNLIEIREKFSWEQDKSKALHSPGVYYFGSVKLAKKYLKLMVEKDMNLNGEYYNSLVYNLLVEDGLNVYIPANVSHFCQWGTPEDLNEFNLWIDNIKQWNN